MSAARRTSSATIAKATGHCAARSATAARNGAWATSASSVGLPVSPSRRATPATISSVSPRVHSTRTKNDGVRPYDTSSPSPVSGDTRTRDSGGGRSARSCSSASGIARFATSPAEIDGRAPGNSCAVCVGPSAAGADARIAGPATARSALPAGPISRTRSSGSATKVASADSVRYDARDEIVGSSCGRPTCRARNACPPTNDTNGGLARWSVSCTRRSRTRGPSSSAVSATSVV